MQFNLGLFLAYNTAAVLSPGPNNITSMALAKSYGLKRSAVYGTGVCLGFSLLGFLCCVFNSGIVTYLPVAKYLLAVLGAVYFVYLAVRTLFSKKGMDADQSTPKIGVLQAAAIQFINPQAIIYGLAVTATFITPYFKTVLAYALICFALGIYCLVANMVWGLFGLAIQKFFSKHGKIVNALMAALLLYCAYTIFMSMFI